MSSRDPDELAAELEPMEFPGDVEFLTELRSEARETIRYQSETLADIDSKAIKILRLNLVMIGVLVSALSLVVQENGSVDELDPFFNPYIVAGLVALVISTAFAAMTYTASELDVGVSAENLINLLQADFTREKREELLVKTYIARINFNRSTNVRNIPLIQCTIVLVFTAVVALALGTFEVVFGRAPPWYSVGGVGMLLLAVLWVSGLPRQFVRAIRDWNEWR